MVDFNYDSLEELMNSNLYHYEVEEMISLMELYFKDRVKFEPYFNGAKKDNLIYEILEKFREMNKICEQELGIKPIIQEPIKKVDVHELVYKFFEFTMGFNKPNSKYMCTRIVEVDEEWFSGDRACYICENCGYSIEMPVELVAQEKERKGHIGIKCSNCDNTIFPMFIRDKNRKVIMKD